MDTYRIETNNNQLICPAGTDYAAAITLAQHLAAARGEAVKLVADSGDGRPEARTVGADGHVGKHWGDHRPISSISTGELAEIDRLDIGSEDPDH